ncbi:hemolysin family protein [Haloechinothrix salitolerans]|uniref:Hemolysin family protein n=1 Tax=Haloechinothrix salitolerans TaxID=926830 RepID=A0ABW2C3H8_9PSEU
MDGLTVTLLLLAVLVALNAVFAGSEIALISLREGQLRQVERAGSGGGRALVRLARDPNRFLATIQIGITLAGFLASATAAVTIAEPLVALLGFLGSAAGPVAIALVTLVLVFITLVLGELAPKRLAMQHALRWALVVARPLDWLATLSRPAVWVLSTATDVTVRLFGGDPHAAKEPLSPDELRDLVATHRGLSAEQRTIITGALEIHERPLRRVLRPRGTVFTLPGDLPLDQAREQLAHAGHTRAPVAGPSGQLDDAIGVVNLRDLIGGKGAAVSASNATRGDTTAGDGAAGEGAPATSGLTVARVAQPPLLFPDSLRVSEALRRFKAERQQFALVVGEHGAVDGIVTLEDLLEEIVGEIYDETDTDVIEARRGDDGTITIPGTFPVHDLTDIGVSITNLPPGDYTTIAGMLLVVLGEIPKAPGDRVELPGWTADVTGVEGHAITEVRLRQR